MDSESRSEMTFKFCFMHIVLNSPSVIDLGVQPFLK